MILLKKVNSRAVNWVMKCPRLCRPVPILEAKKKVKVKYRLKVNLIFKTIRIMSKKRKKIKKMTRKIKMKIHSVVIPRKKKFLMRKKLASKFVWLKQMKISWVKRQCFLRIMSSMTWRLLRNSWSSRVAVALYI